MEKEEGMEALCEGETVREYIRAEMLKEAARSGDWKVENYGKVCVVFPVACLPADVKRK